MSHSSMGFEAADEFGRRAMHAQIVRSEVMFGNIRIRCPESMTEHEVPANEKFFVCPIDSVKLLIN